MIGPATRAARSRRTRTLLRWLVAGLAVTALAAGCAKTGGEEEATSGAATVKPVPGTDLAQVTLTADAVRRLDVQTGTVEGSGAQRTMPYRAVFYDPEGRTWAFVTDAPRTFVRAPIVVDHIDGDTAFLTDGPEPGAAVVTVGGPEIYGAELGVGDDE